jgi:hypothetical protein
VESLPSKKKYPRKKEEKEKENGAMIEKQKRWNLIWKALCFKRRKEIEDEIYKLLGGEILMKGSKKGDHTFL